jgi:hypothetical protein
LEPPQTNNKGFEIQKKVEGNDFAAIGFVQGKGTTTQVQSYSFVDNNVQAGTYQYRLKQIDLDGSYSYSETAVSFSRLIQSCSKLSEPFEPKHKINFLAKESNVDQRCLITGQ